MKLLKSIVLLIFLLTAFSTPSQGRTLEEIEVSEKLLVIFAEIERDGPSERSVNKLKRFILKNRDASIIDEAYLEIGKIYMDRKEFKKASKYFQFILKKMAGSSIKYDATYGLAYCQYRMGQVKESKLALRSLIDNTDAYHTVRAKAKLLLETVESVTSKADIGKEDDSKKITIGVALPLKGKFGKYGKEALKGILLAANIFGSKYGKIEIKVRDIGETEKSAGRAVRALARDKDVIAIIGPLLTSATDAVAENAQKKRVPAIILSQKSNVASKGDYIFRNFLTSENQVHAITNFSTKVLGNINYAILAPHNKYGRTMRYLFKQKLEGVGGNIVSEVFYDPKQNDFGAELKELFAIEVTETSEGRRQIRDYKIGNQIDALFIPDYYDKIAQIAPYLAYYNITGVQLLGTNAWNSPKLAELAGDHLKGSIFVDGFFANSNREETALFARRYRKVFKKTPGLIEAEAYDAASIIISNINKGAITRSSMRHKLESTYDFEGATGRITFDESGESIRELFFLSVQGDNEIVEILMPQQDKYSITSPINPAK